MGQWPVDDFALQIIEKELSRPKTFKQLLISTKLPERTVRYNLSILKKNGEVVEIPYLIDLRSKIFLKK